MIGRATPVIANPAKAPQSSKEMAHVTVNIVNIRPWR
jgi:hypothetical protein